MRQAFVLFALIFFLIGADPAPSTQPASNHKFTYLIVHGAWAGGWAYKELGDMLTADGHKVYRPTMTGQGEKAHLASPDIDLNTHITDIVNVILWEDLHDVVIVGHSYGGMVMTGVVDRVPERIKHVIYVDAFLPENGESIYLNSAVGPGRGPSTGPAPRNQVIKDGFVTQGNPNPNRPLPHDVPQSVKTFQQPIELKHQDVARKIPTTYILTVDRGRPTEMDSFYPFYVRAKERGWTVEIMEGDHNVQWSHTKELTELLEKAP